MKNLILLPIFVFSFLSLAIANNDSGTPVTLIKSESVTVSVDDTETSTFISAEITLDKNNLDFETNKEINFVQIYGEDGKISFQLTVGSKKVRINKNLFDKGDSKVGFKVVGDSQLHYAKVKLK